MERVFRKETGLLTDHLKVFVQLPGYVKELKTMHLFHVDFH